MPATAATPAPSIVMPSDSELPLDPDPVDADVDGPAPYEQAEQQSRARREAEAAQRKVLDKHRAEVDEACTLRVRRETLREQAERYDRDPGFRRRVEAARRDRSRFGWFAAVVAIIFVSDLLLGTPDLAEDLAHSTMSLLPGTGAVEVAASDQDGKAASDATPKWLRLFVGALLSAIVLVVTILVKKVGDETEHHRAQRQVAPGDRETWRRLAWRIWMRRALKGGYMLAMAGFFLWIYTYAHERSEIMRSNAKMPAIEMDFASLGVSLLATGELVTDEATPGDAGSGLTAEDEKGTEGLALGALATYSMLWLLHGLLLLIPVAASSIDRPLASFSPHRAAMEAQAMGEREATLLRNIVSRIYMTPGEDPTRQTLITLSEPVARAVNELYVREIMPLPSPEGSSATGPIFDAAAEEVIPPGAGPDLPEGGEYADAGRFDNESPNDDPGRIIFG